MSARARGHLTAGAVLAVVACLWFWPLFKGDQLGQSFALSQFAPWQASSTGPLPQRAFFVDAAIAFHPWAEVARDQVRNGELPLWNRHEWAGTTLAGNPQAALFFPLSWLLLLFPFGYAWGAMALLKTLLAGVGAYAFSRELRVARGGAMVAGTVYMLSGPLMLWLQYPLGSTFAIFPWLLLAVTRVRRSPGPAPVAGLAVAVALTALAGHPESALIAASAAAVYLLALVAFERGRDADLRLAGRVIGGAVLGAGIAAVMLIPFAQALGPSVTRTEHAFGLPSGGPPLYTLLEYSMPGLFGDGQPHLYGSPFPFGYFGLPALVLALIALVRLRREPPALALATTALVALMAVYHVPPVIWFLENVPPWSGSFVGERAHFVIALVGAVGAGAGFGALSRRPIRVRGALIAVGAVAAATAIGVAIAAAGNKLGAPSSTKRDSALLGTVLLLVALGLVLALGRVRPRLMLPLGLLVAALSLIELQDLNVILPPDRAYPPKPAAVAALQDQAGTFRMGVLRDERSPGTMLPNTASLYGLESIEGYDFPLSRRWSDFQTSVLGFSSPAFPEGRYARTPPTRRALTGLRLMNVSHYLAAPGTPPPARGFRVVHSGRDAVVYRDPRALPRAYVVPETSELSGDQALAVLRAGRLDPRRTALVPPGSPRPAGRRFQAARTERLGADHVRVHLPAGAAGWLVLAQAYSPDWKAEVDGRDTELRTTDYAAMGVPVSASARTVDFRLERRGFWAGAAISLMSLLVTLLLATWGRLRRP